MQWGADLPTVIEAFRAGDEGALAEVYARWSPLVYTLALRLVPDVAQAEEVTQDVFTQAWAARRTVGASTRVPAWLVGITRDRAAALQGSRTAAGRPAAPVPTRAQPQDEPADLAERLVCADELSRLDAVPRQVLQLALDDGLSHAQIAQRLGLPLAAVRDHLRRSLLTLRQRLEVVADAH